MSIINQKKKVFGNIAALRTLTESMPQLKTSSSFPSINNDGNSITFLTDLIKALFGYEALVGTVVDTLVYSLDNIEEAVKNALTSELKSIVSCGVNPSLPSFVKSTGGGVSIKLSKIDFTNLMLVDPTSPSGKILYNDITPNLINSTDFNTFLYQTVQNDGSIENWGARTIGKNVLSVNFTSVDISRVNPNNTLTIRANSSYDNKTLTDFNNDFIDSINLFNTENLITNVVDMVFGTVSTVVNKTVTQLTSEARVNTVVTKILNSDNNDIIGDEYFSFSNAEKNAQELEAKQRKSGKKTFTTSDPISTSVSFDTLTNVNNNIKSTTDNLQKKNVVTDSLNTIGNEIASFSNNPIDHAPLKLNFIQEIINNIIRVIVNSILSPKVLLIFLLNYKIIYGPDATFTDPVDFLKKNRNLVRSITKKIGAAIVKALLVLALKKISELVSEAIVKEQKEKAQLTIAQLLSLVGVPQDTLRQIRGLLWAM